MSVETSPLSKARTYSLGASVRGVFEVGCRAAPGSRARHRAASASGPSGFDPWRQQRTTSSSRNPPRRRRAARFRPTISRTYEKKSDGLSDFFCYPLRGGPKPFALRAYPPSDECQVNAAHRACPKISLVAAWLTADTAMVANLRAAGANIFRKTNVPEFGAGGNSRNRVSGATKGSPTTMARGCCSRGPRGA